MAVAGTLPFARDPVNSPQNKGVSAPGSQARKQMRKRTKIYGSFSSDCWRKIYTLTKGHSGLINIKGGLAAEGFLPVKGCCPYQKQTTQIPKGNTK